MKGWRVWKSICTDKTCNVSDPRSCSSKAPARVGAAFGIPDQWTNPQPSQWISGSQTWNFFKPSCRKICRASLAAFRPSWLRKNDEHWWRMIITERVLKGNHLSRNPLEEKKAFGCTTEPPPNVLEGALAVPHRRSTDSSRLFVKPCSLNLVICQLRSIQ